MPLIDKPTWPGPDLTKLQSQSRLRRAAQPPTLVEIDKARQRRDIAIWNAEVERKKYLKKGRK